MNSRFYQTKKFEPMAFLAKDTFLPITYPLSVALAVAFTALLVYNYATTYIGFDNTFPMLWWWVPTSFMIVVQGVQLIVPLMEVFKIHEDLPFGWRLSMWLGWLLAIVADFFTAIVALAVGAGLVLTAKIVLLDPQLWQTGKGFLLVIFAAILITAEVWVVVSWRAVFFLHPKFWALVEEKANGITAPRPAVSQPTMQRPRPAVNQPINQPVLRPASSLGGRPVPKPAYNVPQPVVRPEPTYHPVGMEPMPRTDSDRNYDA